MKKRAEDDPLKIEPSWEDLVNGLGNRDTSETCAKLIIYGVNTSRPLPPGTILGKVTSQKGMEANLPLKSPVSPEEILKEIESEFNGETARKIRKILGKEFTEKSKVKSLKFDRAKVSEMKMGSIPGISGKWRLKASGGTWTIYTNQDETKVLKAPNSAENGWESAILALTHERVAENIEEKYGDSGLRAPENHNVMIVNVDGSKMAVAVMDYEKNYVTSNSRDGVKDVQKILRKLYESGQIPAHEFDYDQEGLERRNLAYRNGEFIALDLCDKSVLEQEDFLKENGIIEKAEKLGFKKSSSSSFLGSLFNKF